MLFFSKCCAVTSHILPLVFPKSVIVPTGLAGRDFIWLLMTKSKMKDRKLE